MHPCSLRTRPRPQTTLGKALAQAFLLLAAVSSLHAELKLPSIFSDHMVIQQDVPVAIWGTAAPGETIQLSIAGQTKTATTPPTGKWQTTLDPVHSAAPLELTVKGPANTLIVKDVLAGEVWFCSGQSNMVLTVSTAKNYEKERAGAAIPTLRMFTVASGREKTAQDDCPGSWVVCSPDTVGSFSAVSFFFGRELQQTRRCAVGLINSSAGGTLIESWLNLDAQRATPELKPFFAQRKRLLAEFDRPAADARHEQNMKRWQIAADKAKAAGQPEPKQPKHPYASHLGAMDVGGLFNGKIAPLVPYALRGVVWYQGESNATPERSPFYLAQMRLLVQDWRSRWGSELPFVWVQLPNVNRKGAWPEIREAQLKSLALPRTGMAVTIDIGESKDVHPKDKQTVGHRIAQWALGSVYDEKVPSVSGPLPAGHEVRGGEIVLRFSHTDGGLVAEQKDKDKKGNAALKGFVIAGANQAWKPAQARIEGDTVIVSAPNVKQPVAVRYAWAPDPVCNLFNGAGLPASPFRTDDWETLPKAPSP